MAPRILKSIVQTILLLVVAPLPTIFVLRAIQQYDLLSSSRPATAKLFLYLYSTSAVVTFFLLLKLCGTQAGAKGIEAAGKPGKPTWVERTAILEQIRGNVGKLPKEKKDEYKRYMAEKIMEFEIE